VAGQVHEASAQVTRAGQGDVRLKLSVNLYGNPAMTPAEFQRAPKRLISAVSVHVIAPTGQYSDDKLINVGTNRWAFRPEAGVSYPVGRWTLESYAGIWLFTPNDSFFPGSITRRQASLFTLQAHVSREFAQRAWVAFDATWYGGGQTEVDGRFNDNRQDNVRLGATLSLPIARQQSLKFTYSGGAVTRIGGNFRTVGIAWQKIFF
ncbi:MAG: transporter, partial [Solimonas sp.]